MGSVLNLHTKPICPDKRARLVSGGMLLYIAFWAVRKKNDPENLMFRSFPPVSPIPRPLHLSESKLIRLFFVTAKIHRFRSHPVMNQKPQDLRRSAAEKFIESFDQELLRAFQQSEAVTPNPQPAPPEQAVAVPRPAKTSEAIS